MNNKTEVIISFIIIAILVSACFFGLKSYADDETKNNQIQQNAFSSISSQLHIPPLQCEKGHREAYRSIIINSVTYEKYFCTYLLNNRVNEITIFCSNNTCLRQ